MDLQTIRDKVNALPEPPDGYAPPLWQHWRRELYFHLKDDDLEQFMSWPCVYHTMLVNHWNDRALAELSDLPLSMIPHAAPPVWGKPKDTFEGTYISKNLIHQLYHLHLWHKHTGVDITTLNSILEFGGGYGAMALAVRRMGFAGTYTIVDLPEFCLLQEAFLERNASLEYLDGAQWIVNNKTGFSGRPPHADLLIACFSISETDFKERDRFFEWGRFESHLLLFSNKFAEYDNMAYFNDFAKSNSLGFQFKLMPAPHLPEGCFYLFGW